MNNNYLIVAENIGYKINENKLFHNLSFDVAEGEALHICGDNGSGKSTLIRIILGITKQTKGNIKNNSSHGITYLGHKNAIKNYLTLEDNILLMELNDKEELNKYIEILNLRKYMDVIAANLSFGQQKKLALLRIFLNNSDLIIFCTPTSEYKKLILKINSFISTKTIITDIGSSKSESLKIIDKFLRKDIFWTSSHPITGSEVSGPEYGKDNMFEDKWCVLIKDKDTNLRHLKYLNSFWKKIGSKTVIMNSEKHDKIFSITSHLPHLVAYNLVKSAQDSEKKLKFNLIKYSAGGLRDFSRIAASNEIMWRDIFFDNKVNITKAIDLFIKNLKSFKKDIVKKNNKSILKKLTQTKKVRTKIIKLKQDIDKPDFGRN